MHLMLVVDVRDRLLRRLVLVRHQVLGEDVLEVTLCYLLKLRCSGIRLHNLELPLHPLPVLGLRLFLHLRVPAPTKSRVTCSRALLQPPPTHSLMRSMNFLASVTCMFCLMRASLLPGCFSFSALLALSIDLSRLRTSCAVAFVSSIFPSSSCTHRCNAVLLLLLLLLLLAFSPAVAAALRFG